jgi:DNA-binding MarR family transcriptional regulator
MDETKYSRAEALRYMILAAQRQGNRVLNDLLKEKGLTASQAEVLRILEDWKNLSLKELGQLLICEAGSPSRLIERMTQDGLIEKVVDPKDSRFVILQLTSEGLEKARTVRSIEKHLYEYLLEIYSDDELEQMSSLLLRILKGQPLLDTIKKRGFDLRLSNTPQQ